MTQAEGNDEMSRIGKAESGVLKVSMGPKLTHPWPEWTDGRIWTLARGKQFTCTPLSLLQAGRAWAKRHGLRLRAFRVDDRTVKLQAVTMGGNAIAKSHARKLKTGKGKKVR